MKNTKQQTTIASLLTILLFSTGVAANQPAADPDFRRLDTNSDGLISWPEYAAKNPVSGRLNPRRIFDNVDTNRDGYIDTSEFAAMKQRRKKIGNRHRASSYYSSWNLAFIYFRQQVECNHHESTNEDYPNECIRPY